MLVTSDVYVVVPPHKRGKEFEISPKFDIPR